MNVREVCAFFYWVGLRAGPGYLLKFSVKTIQGSPISWKGLVHDHSHSCKKTFNRKAEKCFQFNRWPQKKSTSPLRP